VEVQLHSFIDLGTRWKWVVSFTLRPLYPQRKSPWYPLDRRLGGFRDGLDATVKRKIPSTVMVRPYIFMVINPPCLWV
jgi:hypothetical protein